MVSRTNMLKPLWNRNTRIRQFPHAGDVGVILVLRMDTKTIMSRMQYRCMRTHQPIMESLRPREVATVIPVRGIRELPLPIRIARKGNVARIIAAPDAKLGNVAVVVSAQIDTLNPEWSMHLKTLYQSAFKKSQTLSRRG